MREKKRIKKMKIGLALSGGSALGIAHIGAIKAFQENNIQIDFVSGTSAGAIVATGLAFGVSLEKMIEISHRLSWSNLSQFGYSKQGLNSNVPVGEIISEMIGKGAKIEDANIPLAIVATDIDTGKKIIFEKGSVADAVRASTCIPGFFIPVKINGRKLVDGGLTENLPLSPLEKMGADIYIGVDLGYFRVLKKTRNVLDIINNSYSILIKPQENISFRHATVLVKPHLEEFSSSDFEKVDALMNAGYQAVETVLPKIRKYLVYEEKDVASKGFWEKILDFFHRH